METLNITEEQSLELFDLMADLQEAKTLQDEAWQVVSQAQDRHRELQLKATKLECKIDRIREQLILKDCPYKVGQKFVVADETYDLIKIEYVSAYTTDDIDIRFVGRRKATKGWERNSRNTTVEHLNAFIIDEL